MLLWYKRPHREDMALYPADRRYDLGWEEIAAAADALILNHPEYV